MSAPETIAVVVTRVVAVNSLVKRFHFERPDGQSLPSFSGGAHIVIEMRDGETTRRVPYSLMSSPLDTQDYQVSIRRDDEGRGGSLFMHEKVKVGMPMRINAPTNLFALDRRAGKHLFIAGGIGITPFMAQSAQLMASGENFELHYGVRNREVGSYVDELEKSLGARLRLYCDEAGERIDLDELLASQPLGTHLYVCGPAAMIDWVLDAADRLCWPKAHVHFEHFSKAPPGKPFTVQIASSGMLVDVGAEQSMLEAMESAGVDAPYLCRGGACGQCETRVISCIGEMQHEDHWLDDEQRSAGDKIMPCVSRFCGERLVLDL